MRANKLSAIAPSIKNVGYASFDGAELVDYGIMTIRQGRSVSDILDDIERRVVRMFREKRPARLVIEQNSFSAGRQNIRLAWAIARFRAVAKRHHVAVSELHSRTIRKLICRNGNATEREMAQSLAIRYPELRAYLESNRTWRVKYFMNSLSAIAAGVAFLKRTRTEDRQARGREN